MSGTMLSRALKARMASASKALLAVILSVVLTISLTPSLSWAADPADEQSPAAGESTVEQPAPGADDADADVEGENPSDADPASIVGNDGSIPEPDASKTAPSTQPAAASEEAAVDAAFEDAQIQASVSFIGVDENGNDLVWAVQKTYELDKGATAETLSKKLLADAGLTTGASVGDYGWLLNSVTSPVDGKVYGYDEITGKYWQLFVRGVAASSGASGVVLEDGDVITWYYSAWGDSLPEGDIPVAGEGDDADSGDSGDPGDSDVSLPDYEAAWPGYAGNGAGALTDVATPAGEVEVAWTSEIKGIYDWMTGVSDPIVVNGNIYIVAGDVLMRKDAATGETLDKKTLDASIDSTSRIVYADGLIVVPLSKGRLQALAADTLETVWTTAALPQGKGGDQQSLTTLTVSNGCVYYGTVSPGSNATYGGFFQCVNLKTGKVVWSHEDEAGFYWAGAAVSGSYTVVASDEGILRAFADDGSVAGTLNLGECVRSTVVADGSTLFVVSTDGVLHKIALAGDGSMTEIASTAFGHSSTATPVLANGKVIVAGSSIESYANAWGSQSYYGVIAVVDAVTMKVEHSITTLSDGSNLPAESKSAPLVSVQDGKTYVYFTCNNYPGGVYRYCVGDSAAEEIYTPEGTMQNFCMASIVTDANGALYYTNDSGKLFALKAVPSDDGGEGSDGDNAGSGSDGESSDNGGSDDEASGGDGSDGNASTAPDQDEKPSQDAGSQTGSNKNAIPNQDGQSGTAAGVIAASRQPLSQAALSEADDSQEEPNAAPAAQTTASEEGLAEARAYSSAESVEDGGFNSLALAGMIAGVAGLAAIIAILLKRRRSDDEEGGHGSL